MGGSIRHGKTPASPSEPGLRNERRLLGETFSLREKDPSRRQRNGCHRYIPLKYKCLIGAILLLPVLAAMPKISVSGRKPLSSTKAFSIDGRRFLLEESAGDDLSLLRRMLRHQGLDFPISGAPSPEHPAFTDALREEAGKIPDPPLSLPPGFRSEHTLRLDSGNAPVDIASGRIEISGTLARNRMSASGWESIAQDVLPSATTVSRKIKGRETLLVFLDETEGRFLLFRRLE